MAITRTAWTDDDGSGTTGTIINNAEKTTIYNQIDAAIDGADATTRSVAKGGTGATTLTAHGVVIGNGASAVAVTAVGATGTVLRGVTGADPAYGAVVLTTDVSGILPTANGGVAAGTSNPTTTGTETALAIPTGRGDLAIFMNNASLLTVQGITAGLDGQVLTIFSKGAGQIDFAHQHASGTALGKLTLFATSGLTSLAAGSGVAVFQYDLTLTKWRLVTHEQGAWITPTFSAGNYTSTGTWTVASGDVITQEYHLSGRTLKVNFRIATTTVSGTPASLAIGNGAWGGFTSTSLISVNGSGVNSGAAAEVILSQTTAGGTSIANTQLDAGTWSNATDTTLIQSCLTFQVN